MSEECSKHCLAYGELERRLAEERDWQAAAERVWAEHEWLRNRVGELERLLGESHGELDALRRERQEIVGRLDRATETRHGMEKTIAECAAYCRELEGRLTALNQRLQGMRLSLRDRVRGRLTHMP